MDMFKSLMGNGRSSSFLIFGIPNTIINHPSDLERILANSIHIEKGTAYDSTRLWLKEGLLTSTGKKWHHRRKILTPTFHFKILEDWLPVMNEHAIRLSQKFLSFNNEAAAIDDLVSLCTLDIICETAMGIKLNSQLDKAIDYVRDIKRITSLLLKVEKSFWLWNRLLLKMFPTGRELFAIIARLQDFTKKVIAERKQLVMEYNRETEKGKRRMAFLDCLLEAELKNPGTFSDNDIGEEVDTFMFEGHDTVSAAILFCLLMLGQHKEVQERAVRELNGIFDDSDRPATITDLQDMKYLEMIIKETLRLYPSVTLISRYLTSDLQLEDGNIIPASSNVLLSPYLIHIIPSIYEDPERFDPERFSNENSKTRHPFAYIPFSAGPRNCIGQKFAMMELKVIISNILRTSKLEAVSNSNTLKFRYIVIIRPTEPLYIRFSPRH